MWNVNDLINYNLCVYQSIYLSTTILLLLYCIIVTILYTVKGKNEAKT